MLEEEAFQNGDFDTHFLESLDLSKPRGKEEQLAAAVAAIDAISRLRSSNIIMVVIIIWCFMVRTEQRHGRACCLL